MNYWGTHNAQQETSETLLSNHWPLILLILVVLLAIWWYRRK